MRKLLQITFTASIIWNLLIFIALFPILRLYALSRETVRLVIKLVIIHNIFNAVLFPLAGPFPNDLRVAGDVKFPMYASLFATVICRVGLSILFAIKMNMGVIGIAWAMCADWGIKASILLVRFYRGRWKGFQVI
ncbi:MAG: hypothetical protein GX316_02440 [Firmicutes bacterium]|nr:hypothetical protein [Bacillota bacterium]